jgi:hypothetical protein
LEAEEERGLDWIEVEGRRFGGEVLWGFIFGARTSGGKEFGGGGKVRKFNEKTQTVKSFSRRGAGEGKVKKKSRPPFFTVSAQLRLSSFLMARTGRWKGPIMQ